MANREQINRFRQRLATHRDRLLTVPLSYLASVVLPPLVVLVLAGYAIVHFLKPLPPNTLEIAIGNPRGSYAHYAEHYRQVFARAGVRLILVPTEGAGDSLSLLHDPKSRVGAAILQDGLASQNSTGILSVGAIGYEPIWVFYRSADKHRPWSRLSDLAGQRVNIGRWGAGTQPFALELLREAGLQYNVESFTPPGHNIQLSTRSGLESLEALKSGQIDATITLGEPDSPTVQAFFHTPGIRAMPIGQAEAVSRHRPFLHAVTIPEGGIDLPSNIPAEPLVTLATTSVVYVREDLHPALVTLLASAMVETHQDATLLGHKHEFPSDQDETVSPHPVASRYLKNGAPLLMRYLPFWLAALLDRTFVVVLPLLALLIPASRLLPQLYGWRIRRRLDRWYAELKFLEAELDREDVATDRVLLLDRIAWIEQQLSGLRVPLSFSNQLYILKEHLELVRRRILRVTRSEPSPGQTVSAAPAAPLPD